VVKASVVAAVLLTEYVAQALAHHKHSRKETTISFFTFYPFVLTAAPSRKLSSLVNSRSAISPETAHRQVTLLP
jgi:hypothetical protein